MGNRPEGLIRPKKEEKTKKRVGNANPEYSQYQLKRKTDQLCVG
jgi:hypothetical protein